jgi:hypothetical protein
MWVWVGDTRERENELDTSYRNRLTMKEFG